VTTAGDDPARCFPILPSLDLAETERFYRDQLGFAVESFGDYLICRRGAMEIHVTPTQDRAVCEQSSCYIRGGQVEDLYDEYRDRGVTGLSDFAVRPWNMKEFYVRDPHGTLMKFGMAPEEVRR
jgi:hypothetical protein